MGRERRVSHASDALDIYATSTRNHEVMKILLRNGADKDVKIVSGKTALDIAKSKHDAIAMKILENAKRVRKRQWFSQSTKKNSKKKIKK